MFLRSIQAFAVLATAVTVFADGQAPQRVRHNEYQVLEGHQVREKFTSDLPYTYIDEDDLPESFNWGNVNGHSYLTHSLNQHIPQYCGSCWAHGALSALSDRIKITNSSVDEINLSIQFILNCGTKVAGR